MDIPDDDECAPNIRSQSPASRIRERERIYAEEVSDLHLRLKKSQVQIYHMQNSIDKGESINRMLDQDCTILLNNNTKLEQHCINLMDKNTKLKADNAEIMSRYNLMKMGLDSAENIVWPIGKIGNVLPLQLRRSERIRARNASF